MSSLASAPAGAQAARPRATGSARAGLLRFGTDVPLGASIGVVLTLLAFLTTGGVDLGPNTWSEIALTGIGALAAAAVLLLRPGGPHWGAATLFAFSLLTLLTVLSIAWSVEPNASWIEAGRTVSYLAALGTGIAMSRLSPGRWAAMLGGVALATVALSGYALLVRVFPGTLDPGGLIGRVRAPFDYWNASGLMAAMGLPPVVWAGARTDRGRALRALAVPGGGLLLCVVVLSYSRSAVIAGGLGLVCWFALVPLRLRGAAVLTAAAATAAPLVAWALGTDAFTRDHVNLAARTAAGHGFGVLLVLVLVLGTALGFATAFAADRITLSPAGRRQVGSILLAGVALIPVGGLIGISLSPRGLSGEASHLWKSLTNPAGGAGNTPGRLVDLSNTRPRYWGEGLKVGAHKPLGGAGAGSFAVARARYTSDQQQVQHAHSYPIETFADLGLLGVAASLVVLIAWGVAAARPLRGSPLDTKGDRPPVEMPPERIGLFTMLAVVIAFGAHSAIDWTWFVPGTAVPALVLAGWLAGRGPLSAPGGEVSRPAPSRSRIRPRPTTIFAITWVAAIWLLLAWAIWQPLRAADEASVAVAALAQGNGDRALSEAQAAHAHDPLALDPLYTLSAIANAAQQPAQAERYLRQAADTQPENPDPWRNLGFYDLSHGRPHHAEDAFLRVLALDPGAADAQTALAGARVAARTATADAHP